MHRRQWSRTATPPHSAANLASVLAAAGALSEMTCNMIRTYETHTETISYNQGLYLCMSYLIRPTKL